MQRLGEFQIKFRPLGRILVDCLRELRDTLPQIAPLFHLRDGEIQLVFRCMRQLFGIVQDHRTTICVGARLPPFRLFCQEVSRGLLPLDKVIRYGHVDYVLRAPFRHVTTGAAVCARVFPRRDLPVESRPVALTADRGVMPLCRFSPRSIMRIVASGAQHLAIALQKTGRAAQAISRVDDLELFFPAGPWRVIEIQDVRFQGLARTVCERAAIISLNRVWQWEAGGLQMAGHANLHLALCAQPGRIHYGAADVLPLGACGRGQLHVPAPRTMTPLAIDAFRQRTLIDGLRERLLMPRGNRWIRVVAEHAIVCDGAAELEC